MKKRTKGKEGREFQIGEFRRSTGRRVRNQKLEIRSKRKEAVL